MLAESDILYTERGRPVRRSKQVAQQSIKDQRPPPFISPTSLSKQQQQQQQRSLLQLLVTQEKGVSLYIPPPKEKKKRKFGKINGDKEEEEGGDEEPINDKNRGKKRKKKEDASHVVKEKENGKESKDDAGNQQSKIQSKKKNIVIPSLKKNRKRKTDSMGAPSLSNVQNKKRRKVEAPTVKAKEQDRDKNMMKKKKKKNSKPIKNASETKVKAGKKKTKPPKKIQNQDEVEPHFEMLDKNEYLERYEISETKEEAAICSCKVDERTSKNFKGCNDDTCVNRSLFIECSPEYCPCKDKCTNNRMQKRQYAKLKLFKAGKKGWGIQAVQKILPGEFVIEYVGEVISNDLCLDRMQGEYRKDKHFYFLTIDAKECIDASRKGNLARFINHSCDPNCVTEKWLVLGEHKIGIFAKKVIHPGEEVTFDYQYVRFGAKKQECYCGSTICRSYLGAKPIKLDTPHTPKKRKILGKFAPVKAQFAQLIEKLNVFQIQAQDLLQQLDFDNKTDGSLSPIFLKRNARNIRVARLVKFRELVEQNYTSIESQYNENAKKHSDEVIKKRQAYYTPPLALETLIKRHLAY